MSNCLISLKKDLPKKPKAIEVAQELKLILSSIKSPLLAEYKNLTLSSPKEVPYLQLPNCLKLSRKLKYLRMPEKEWHLTEVTNVYWHIFVAQRVLSIYPYYNVHEIHLSQSSTKKTKKGEGCDIHLKGAGRDMQFEVYGGINSQSAKAKVRRINAQTPGAKYFACFKFVNVDMSKSKVSVSQRRLNDKHIQILRIH